MMASLETAGTVPVCMVNITKFGIPSQWVISYFAEFMAVEKGHRVYRWKLFAIV